LKRALENILERLDLRALVVVTLGLLAVMVAVVLQQVL